MGHIAAVIFFASIAGRKLSQDSLLELDDVDFLVLKNDNVHTKSIFKAISYTALFSLVFCILWIVAIMKFAESIIKCSFLVWASFYGVGFVRGLSPKLSTESGYHPLSIFCALIFVWLMVSYFMIRNRIAFASANLKTACRALRAHCSVVNFVILDLLISFAWCVLWTFAILGAFTEKKLQICFVSCFLALMSLYWGNEVWTNVSHVTISGTVASWWFHPEGAQEGLAVSSSWCRAMTTSFGSICLGSLLVAIVEALHGAINCMANQKYLKYLVCCLKCIVGCIEKVMRYFNRYAFVYIGIDGSSFCSAGYRVSTLFSKLGFFGTVCNDFVISRALTFGIIGISVVSGVVGFEIGNAIFADHGASLACMTFGFIIGYAMASVTSAVVSSAVATVYVAFGENSQSLRAHHPEMYEDLKKGWNSLYPNVINKLLESSTSV